MNAGRVTVGGRKGEKEGNRKRWIRMRVLSEENLKMPISVAGLRGYEVEYFE